MDNIQLNFVPLIEQSLKITAYRKLVNSNEKKLNKEDYRTKLPLYEGSEEWLLYDISNSLKDGYEEFYINYGTNPKYSEYFLLNTLQRDLAEFFTCDYCIPEKSKYKEVIFVTEKHDRGQTQISVSPYFLKAKGMLGFVIQHSFRYLEKNTGKFDRNIQQLSLSIDSMGRPNTFYFRDKEEKIRNFIDTHFSSFVNEKFYDIDKNFISLEPRRLKDKSYIVKGNKSVKSQFMGVKSYGPFNDINDDIRYLFIFPEKARPLARDMYLGLTGKLFPTQFSGLEKMFNLNISRNNVDHLIISSFNNYSLQEIGQTCESIKNKHPKSKLMVILVTPKDNNTNTTLYIQLKSLSLSMSFVCQAVTEELLQRRENLKWSISNIGLQVFCKLGGKPWLVKPEKNNCLILGIGSAHKIKDDIIEKYTAYTICLNSSGEFKYVQPLSTSRQHESYLANLEENLRQLIEKEIDNNYESIVLHVPFKIKKSEVESIRKVISDFKDMRGCELVVIRINTKHRFLGFGNHNTRVAYESTLIELSSNQFLIWVEGLQEGKEVLNKRVSQPILVDFLESPWSWKGKASCLQDILNLTGANWRGFNAKAQPISILYPKLIADFMKELSIIGQDKELINYKSESPWFL